jgi:Reticulon
LGAFISYYLIKIVPFWGLCLIATSVAFLVPLVYITNKELIDHHIKNASDIVNHQTAQVKQLASHHAAVAAETTKQYASDYSAKAQEMIGVPRARSQSPAIASKPIKSEKRNDTSNALKAAPEYTETDFPNAPKEEIKVAPSADSTTVAPHDEKEPLIAT